MFQVKQSYKFNTRYRFQKRTLVVFQSNIDHKYIRFLCRLDFVVLISRCHEICNLQIDSKLGFGSSVVISFQIDPVTAAQTGPPSTNTHPIVPVTMCRLHPRFTEIRPWRANLTLRVNLRIFIGTNGRVLYTTNPLEKISQRLIIQRHLTHDRELWFEL